MTLRNFSVVFILIVSALLPLGANASHIFGADFYYTHDTGNIYTVSLVIYGDCSGQSFPALQGATPSVKVIDRGTTKTTITLHQDGPGVEVTPVCTSLLNSTTCSNLSSTLKGVKRFIYSTSYTLPYASSGWLFRFEGTMAANSQAGRSNAITNIVFGAGSGGSVVTLEAFLNNIGGDNSSPTFTTIPTPFYCINVPQNYNQGAVDIDKDSLVYALAPGLEGTGYVTYASGYSATMPLAVAAGSFSFSTLTGQLNFTPNSVQTSLVVNQVSEYRKGVLVGTASREMTFIVLGSCNNQPASGIIDTTVAANNGGLINDPTTFNVCEGTDSANFSIIAVNPSNDTLVASVTGLPAGSIATIAQNNSTTPVIHVGWKTATISPGSYNFYVTYKDNGCPLTSVQTVAYSIRVITPNAILPTMTSPNAMRTQGVLPI